MLALSCQTNAWHKPGGIKRNKRKAPAMNEQTSTPRLDAIVLRLPRTADGMPFFIGDTVYMPNEDREYFGPEDVLEVKVESLSQPVSFAEYRGNFNVIAGDVEGGNLDFYSSREAAARMVEMTPEEADAAYDDAPAIPMSEDEIREIVAKVTGC